jgi:hypothetical protein
MSPSPYLAVSSELDLLIAEQERDRKHGHHVHGDVIDALALAHLVTLGRDGMAALETRPVLVHDDRHGTLYCYKRLGCRCPQCKAASAAWQREWRKRRATPVLASAGKEGA